MRHCAAFILLLSSCVSISSGAEEGRELVVGISKSELLKRAGISPGRVEVASVGWLVDSKGSGEGSIAGLAIAVCLNREAANALLERVVLHRNTAPVQPLVKIGNQCVSGKGNLQFIRDNVFIHVDWKGTTPWKVLQGLDTFLTQPSDSVKRGEFKVKPTIEGIPDRIDLKDGEKKQITPRFFGFGKERPVLAVTSPGRSDNRITDQGDIVVSICGNDKADARYDVIVSAVGEDLVYIEKEVVVVVSKE